MLVLLRELNKKKELRLESVVLFSNRPRSDLTSERNDKTILFFRFQSVVATAIEFPVTRDRERKREHILTLTQMLASKTGRTSV